MKRPSLSLGIATLILTPLLLLENKLVYVAVTLIAVAVLIFYFFSKKLKNKNLYIIPIICIFTLLSLLFFFLNQIFVKEKALSLVNKNYDIIAVVAELPDTFENNSYHQTHYVLKVISANGKKVNCKLSYYTSDENNFKLYDTLFIDNAEIADCQTNYLYAEKIFISLENFSSIDKIAEKGKDFYYYCLKLKELCTEKFSLNLKNDAYGIAVGLFFGGTDYISADTRTAFKNAGITHILSVSGLHTSLWCGFAIAVFKLLKTDVKKANLLCVIILIALAIVSGFTPPVLRSVFMMAVILSAPFFKKESDSLNSLGISIIILLIFNPYILYTSSFILSSLATFGVILSTNMNYSVKSFTNKFKNNLLKRITNYILTTLAVSTYSIIFTLPALIYYFGTVSIIAPLTNLLTVELTFVIMIVLLISLVISFIPFEPFFYLSDLAFDISDYLLKFLTNLVKYIGELKYATLPVNIKFLFISIAVCVLLFLIYKKIVKTKILLPFFRRLLLGLCFLPLVSSILFSLLPLSSNSEIVILPNSANVSAVLRVGTDYAVINLPNKIQNSSYIFLPKTKSENVNFFALNHLNKNSVTESTEFLNKFAPDEIVVTEFILQNFSSTLKKTCNNIKIANENYTYNLNDKINIEFFNTYGLNCAIINFDGKIIVLSFSEYNDFKQIEEKCKTIDVIVFGNKIPETLNIYVDTIILTSAFGKTNDENEYIARRSCKNFYQTATEGEIIIRR